MRSGSDSEEGRFVANNIFETKMNTHGANKDFAILYRTNAQSRALEEALRKQNVPYKIFGGLSFYQRKEIKDLLAYFRLIINQDDEEALLRIINYPTRGIGATSQQKLAIKAQEHDVSIWEVIKNMRAFDVGLSSAVANKIEQFRIMMESFSAQLHKKKAFDLAKHIVATTGMIRTLNEDKTPEGISRFENMEELLNAINEFSERDLEPEEEEKQRTLDVFMQDVALLTDQDNDDKNDSDKVSLMTIHAAKGLEFPYVYIVGMEENLFPSMLSLNTRADLEEERRLFYVALTRAEQRLTLSYAEMRYKWGNVLTCEPSRFIEEIDENFLHPSSTHFDKRQSNFRTPAKKNSPFDNKNTYKKLSDPASKNMKKATLATPKNTGAFPAANPSEIQPGIEVEHQRFGKGKVQHVEGKDANKKATIFFKGIGQKNLLLKFARLKIIKS